MARIKKYSPEQNLSSFQTFVIDDNPNSDYFRITEFNDTFTGGKNGFLIEGSQYLKETTEIKIEILDVEGNPIYYEPAKGVPEYYEGISSLIAVYIYNDTPIGLGKITVLGELKQYDDNGVIRDVPDQWKGNYNVKWENDFQINKILANEDRVRFFKRPKVNIGEINKPIFNNNANLITQIGNVNGIPLAPTAGTSLSEFSLPTSYRLNVTNGSNWTGSIDGNRISFDDIDYNPIVLDVVSETEVIVSPPYAPNGIVAPFSNESYVSSFNYLEGVTDLATALTGSFAKISITDMKTAVGDAARVKVYRRSQSNLTDYEFVQEIQLESNELLRDIETTEANEISYGTFTQDVLSQYWITSSNDISVELNTGFLYNSAKLNSTEGNHFLTKQSFPIQSGVEYTLDFNLKKGSVSPTDFLKVTLSGSLNGTPKSQTIVNIPSSNAILQKRNFTENIIADDFDEAKLYFEVDGVDWYVNNVSLKASQETSFSPDEITFIQQVPKTLQTETFDYRFEFYDINNNYIPILVEDTKTFNGGNLNLFNKDITLTPNNLYFSFDSASAPANPLPPTTITFDVETTLVTGSVTYTSGAYDEFGDILLSSQYAGGQYPGLMSGYETLSPTLTVADFTGSRDDITVQYIRFTGEVEGVSDDVVITRSQDGKGGVNFEIRPYRGTIIKNKGEETLELQAIRIDGINEIILRDNLPQNGFSDAKLRIQSGSEYILLSDAQSSGFIQGLTAGTTGSGELDYNAVFDRTSITGQLPLYLMDGTTEEDILTTLILTDLQDGLGAGFTIFDVEQFNINPKEDTIFTPQTASLSGNFYLRGTNESPISGTLKVFPSMSIDSALLTEYYMFFETGAFDSRITVTATNAQNEIIGSGIPGDSVEYYTPIDSKQLTFNFTYVEDFTSESISVDKTIFVAPDGLGIEPVIANIDPIVVNLNSNQEGAVYDYSLLDTKFGFSQGEKQLTYNDSAVTMSAGSWDFYDVPSINNIEIKPNSGIAINDYIYQVSHHNMPSESLVANISRTYKITPFYTSSNDDGTAGYYYETITQRITKGVDGSDAIEIEIKPSTVTLQADENGTIPDYSTADTDILVKQGNLYLSYETSSLPGTYTVSATGSGIVVGDISASSQYDLDFGDETVHYTNFSELEPQSGSVDYNFYVYPYSLTNGVAGVEEVYSKRQIFSKSNDGTAARSVTLATTTAVVNFDGDGVVTSPVGSIFLEATPFNVTGSQSYYQFFRDGFAYSLVGTENIFEIGSGDATSPGETATWSVKVRDGNIASPVVASAEVTIAGIKAGADNYQVSLTNPSPNVGVTVAGTLTLDTTGTQIRAFKAATELTHVSTYSSETVNSIGDPIGTLGEFSSSLHYIPTFITQPNFPTGNPANIDPITDWNIPSDNKSATLIYKVDIENGRATYFLSQSLSTVFEGATGPGIVMRGEWTGSVDYLFSLEQKRRDAVVVKFDNGSGGDVETHYFGTTENFVTSSTQPYSTEPAYSALLEQGDIVSNGWEYLGEQDMFVAAKIAIFEESFVENTINVGIPPVGSPNANIAIAGGSDEPYIAIGQQGVQGFQQDGIFMGMSNAGGASGTSTLGLLSLKSEVDNGEYNSLEWNGDTLTIRGALRQTAAGQREGTLQGLWSQTFTPANFQFVENDIVTHADNTWVCISNHTKNTANSEPLNGSSYETYWATAAAAGTSGTAGINAKTIRLSTDAQSFIVAKDGTISPSTITLTSSRQNISDSTVFTSSPNVTLGGSGDTATLSKENFGSNTAVTITATADGFSDEITIVKLTEGTDALTIINSNQAHTLPASPTGVVSSYVGSGTSINLFEGTTPLNHKLSYPQAAGDFTINFSGTDITTASPSTGYSPTFTISDASNMTDSVDIASIDFEICIKRLDGTTVTGSIKQSFSKSKTGTNGTPGSTGAGIVYRGEFSTTDTYTSNSTRTDVVKYNGSYIICNTDGATGAYVANEWDSFGAEFTSVATDILFATDVYADQTINVGSSGSDAVIALNADAGNSNANPYISIGQSPQGFESDGIFMGFDSGTASLSLAGDNVKTNIGGWQVDKSGLFYEAEYTVGDVYETVAFATSSLLVSAVRPGMWYGGFYSQVYNTQFASNGTISQNECPQYFARTADPFGSGSMATVNGAITTNHNVLSVDFSSLVKFELSPELYALTSSVDLLSYVTSSWEIAGTGKSSDLKWVASSTQISSSAAWNDVMSQTSGQYNADYLEYNLFGLPSWAPNANAYILAEGVTIPASGGVAAYESASLAIKLGTIEGDRFDLANNGIDGSGHLKSHITNPHGEIDLAAATKLTLYTIHRTGEDISTNSVGSWTAGSFGERIVTGDAIRLSTSGSAQGSNKPFISMGQDTAGYNRTGVFLGFPSGSESPQFSLRSPNGNFMRYNGDIVQLSGDIVGATIEQSNLIGGSINVPSSGPGSKFSVDAAGNVSASNANISGIINADSGRIGDWIIDADTNSLRDSDSEIIFNPGDAGQAAEIQLFEAGAKKVIIGPQSILTNTAGSTSVTLSWANVTVPRPTSLVTATSAASPFNQNSNYSIGTATTLTDGAGNGTTSVAAGDISVAINRPGLTLYPPTQTVSHTTSYPNYSPTYNGQNHGSYQPLAIAQRGYIYLEVIDTNNSDAIIGRKLIGQTSYARSARKGAGNYYTGVVSSGGGGGGLSSIQYSVVGNTKITLSDGSLILAKDVKKGQTILAWNWNDKIDTHIGVDRFSEFTIDAVKTRTTNEIYKITVGDKVIEVSDSHGFWKDNNKEIPAKELIEGESKIYVKDGDTISLQLVDKVEILEGDKVYTFSVPGVHNYISNDILSHNIAQGTWNYNSYAADDGANNGTLASAYGQTIIVPISTASTAAKFRYSVRVSTSAGVATDFNSSGNATTRYITSFAQYDGSSSTTVSSNSGRLVLSTLDNSLVFSLPSNFVEIKAGGIQVVSDEVTFVKIPRTDGGGGEIFKAKGGISYFEKASSGTDTTTAINTLGDIIPNSNSLWDIGSSSKRFANLNGVSLTDFDERIVKAHCRFRGTTSGTTSVLSPSYNVSSITRNSTGAYTVNLTDTLTSGTALPFIAGYGNRGDTNSQSPTDEEFSLNVATKVDGTAMKVTFKDNNSDTNQDPYEAYFVVFGPG